MRTRTRLGGGGGGGGWVEGETTRVGASAGRVTLSGGTTFSHINTLARLPEMAQIVSGTRQFVQYVTCLAVSRETSVLEGTAVTTHN